MADPIPGQQAEGGIFDNGAWRQEAAQLFSDRFHMGGAEEVKLAFKSIASGDQAKMIEGLRRLPDVTARFAALQTFLELHAAQSPTWTPEQIDGFLKTVKQGGLFDSSEWRKEAAVDVGQLATKRRARDMVGQFNAVKQVQESLSQGHIAPAPGEVKPVIPTPPIKPAG